MCALTDITEMSENECVALKEEIEELKKEVKRLKGNNMGLKFTIDGMKENEFWLKDGYEEGFSSMVHIWTMIDDIKKESNGIDDLCEIKEIATINVVNYLVNHNMDHVSIKNGKILLKRKMIKGKYIKELRETLEEYNEKEKVEELINLIENDEIVDAEKVKKIFREDLVGEIIRSMRDSRDSSVKKYTLKRVSK